jgi:hypothetical protein
MPSRISWGELTSRKLSFHITVSRKAVFTLTDVFMRPLHPLDPVVCSGPVPTSGLTG